MTSGGPSPLPPLSILSAMREMAGEEGVVPAPMVSSEAAFPVLVSTIVSLRTRDAVTRQVSANLFRRVSDPRSMSRMDRAELEALLRPAGFYRQKAKQLIDIASILIEKHGGEVPGDMEELLALPGVGRKTANFVLGMVFGIPAICVDIHVHRISNRLGLVRTKDPEGTEMALRELFPEEWWSRINHTMVVFGQRICRPVGPRCGECLFREWCPEAASSGDGE